MKKIFFVLSLVVATIFATGCTKDEAENGVSSLDKIILGDVSFSSSNNEKLHLDPSTYNRLLYDENDVIYVNGVPFTLHYVTDHWEAHSSTGSVSNDEGYFNIAYADGLVANSYTSNAPNYTFDISNNVSEAWWEPEFGAPTSGIVLAGSTDNNVVTLTPCCAIIRLDPDGEVYDQVQIGFEYNTRDANNKVVRNGVISTSDGTIQSGSSYLDAAANGGAGEFITMKYYSDGVNSFYYAGVPLLGNSINTKIWILAKDGETHIQNVTSNFVNIYKGHVYSVKLRPGGGYLGSFDDNGAMAHGRFTINSGGGTVKFSRGNLQYRPSINLWRFAPTQNAIRGVENEGVTSEFAGWIDLFGYGTSGKGNPSFAPYTRSMNNADYFSGNISDNYNYDWGNNSIVDPTSNQTSTYAWRTLTQDEWNYLLNTRTNHGSKWGYATVAGREGMVILPDSWTLPAQCSFTPYQSGGSYTTNTYTTETWERMEVAGAVFLPTTGNREGTAYNENGEGDYWTSTGGVSLQLYGYAPAVNNYYSRFVGCSVRLVTDAL